MTTRDPIARPDAASVLQQWRQLRGNIHMLHRVWRLRRRTEPLVLNIVQAVLDMLVVSLLVPLYFLGRWIPVLSRVANSLVSVFG